MAAGVAAGGGGGLGDGLAGAAEAVERLPDAGVAVGEAAGALEGGVAAAADENGDGARGLGVHGDVSELIVVAAEGDVVLAPEQLEDLDGFVGAGAAGVDVDAAGLELLGVLAADADAEDEAAAGELVELGGLEGDGGGVAQGEEVDAGLELDALGDRSDGGEREEAVGAVAVEGDVVAGVDAVEAGGLGAAGGVEGLSGVVGGGGAPAADGYADLQLGLRTIGHDVAPAAQGSSSMRGPGGGTGAGGRAGGRA